MERGLTNIELRRGDLERLPFADQSFGGVICVFGIFFVPDLEGAVRGLWRLVRPGGYLAITIWGPKMFEPADGKFWEAVRRADPELFGSIKPWNKIVETDPLRALLVECGVSDPVVVAEPGTHPLNAPEDWYSVEHWEQATEWKNLRPIFGGSFRAELRSSLLRGPAPLVEMVSPNGGTEEKSDS